MDEIQWIQIGLPVNSDPRESDRVWPFATACSVSKTSNARLKVSACRQ